MECDPAPEPRVVDVERLGGGDDVRMDEVEAVARAVVPVRCPIRRGRVAVGQEQRVVLAEDVRTQEREDERHRSGVEHPRRVRESHLDPGFDGAHHPAERRDVGVDPVVSVLHLDRLGDLEVETADRPQSLAGVADVRGVPLAVRGRQIERSRVGSALRGGRDGAPVDGRGAVARAGRPRDRANAPIEVHTEMWRSDRKTLVPDGIRCEFTRYAAQLFGPSSIPVASSSSSSNSPRLTSMTVS